MKSNNAEVIAAPHFLVDPGGRNPRAVKCNAFQ